jgi:hypothetical protein
MKITFPEWHDLSNLIAYAASELNYTWQHTVNRDIPSPFSGLVFTISRVASAPGDVSSKLNKEAIPVLPH